MRKAISILALLWTTTLSAQFFSSTTRTVRSGTADPGKCQPDTDNIFINRNSTPILKICTAANTWAQVGAIAGSVGATDNAIIRADGTGGATIQGSAATITDAGSIVIPVAQGLNYGANSAIYTGGTGPAWFDVASGATLQFDLQSLTLDRIVTWPNAAGTVTLNGNGAAFALTSVAFASLGTPANGTAIYCSDCTKATPCASGGSGAFAKRINGAWDCD